MSPSASVDERVCFVGQYHESNGDVLRKVALALQAENRELWFLPHPKDVPSKRKWTVPENCHELTKEQGMSAKLGAVTAAPLVVTEYSNLGYSLALAGTRVLYVFEDPPEGEPLVHVAVELGKQDRLPVRRCRPSEVLQHFEWPAVDFHPQLDVASLEKFLARQARPA